MMDAFGALVSPKITKLNNYTIQGTFKYWDPDKDEGFGYCDTYQYGTEYIEMNGVFPFLIRWKGGSGYIMDPPAEKFNPIKDTAGKYLILVSDPTFQLTTDVIAKKGSSLGLKIDSIEHTLTQSAICISFSEKGKGYLKRWLFPHPEGIQKAVDVLKQTTLLDDWEKMKQLLPSLEERDQKTALYFFLEHLPEENQMDALILLEEE